MTGAATSHPCHELGVNLMTKYDEDLCFECSGGKSKYSVSGQEEEKGCRIEMGVRGNVFEGLRDGMVSYCDGLVRKEKCIVPSYGRACIAV